MTAPASLRLALVADAVVSGANGVAYLALAGPLADLFDVPAGFLRVLGAVLVVFAAGVWLATRDPQRLVPLVFAANVAWAAGSVALLALDLHEPSAAGLVWTALQALVVAGFATLQASATTRPARRAV